MGIRAFQDANGNMTSDGTNAYSWDACDRLVQITYPGSGNNSQFSYDGVGRCVQITENVSGTPTTLEFVWCGSKRCETRNGTGFGTVVSQFFGMGEVIGGTSYFYTKDHLGSVRELTNGSGVIKAQYGYDPYGVKSNIVAEVVPSDFQYAGYYLHSRSGLNLTRTRAYNAALGRFINRDMIGERGGVNLYGYVMNNPISRIDPSGEQQQQCFPWNKPDRGPCKDGSLPVHLVRWGYNVCPEDAVVNPGSPTQPLPPEFDTRVKNDYETALKDASEAAKAEENRKALEKQLKDQTGTERPWWDFMNPFSTWDRDHPQPQAPQPPTEQQKSGPQIGGGKV